MKKIYLMTLLLLAACTAKQTPEVPEENVTAQDMAGETADSYSESMFTTYAGDFEPRADFCPVRYYAKDGVLYSSEKYHALSLYYSKDSDNSLSYLYMVIFDRNQEADADGWFSLDLKDADIPRIPDTHLSGVIMKNYYGDLTAGQKNYIWPDAALYNNTKEVGNGRDRKVMDAQIVNLLPYIR